MGCSSGKSGNPVMPSSQLKTDVGLIELPVAVPSGDFSNIGIMGLYNLEIDTEFQSAYITPLRSTSALGDSFNVDITHFLNVTPCPDCIRITGVEMESDNTFTVYIGARHPFPLPADINNPQLNERLDLHVFDVQGVLILDGSVVFPLTISDINGDNFYEESIVASPGILVNADGYSSILDSFYDTIIDTGSNIHPFKMFSLKQ